MTERNTQPEQQAVVDSFNPNLTTGELMQLPPDQIRAWRIERDARRAAIAELDEQPTASTTHGADKKGRSISLSYAPGSRVRTAGLVATSLLAGAAIWAGGTSMMGFGKAGAEGGSPTPTPSATLEPTATPSPEPTQSAEPTKAPSPEPTQSAEPTKAPSPEPTQSAEGNSYTPKDTDKAQGFLRANLELSDVGGGTIQVDKLGYVPSEDPNNPKKITVMAGAIIDGDANINGVWSTDSLGESGSRVIILQDGAVVDSKYGFTIYENYDPKYTDLIMQEVGFQQEKTGCGLVEGCTESIAQTYTADGKLIPYTSDTQIGGEQPVDNAGENQHPADCQCTVCCIAVAPTAAPCPTAEPAATPTPEAECVTGYDNDLQNIYNGNLEALKKAASKNPNKVVGKNIVTGEEITAGDYVEVVQPGERVAIQGDVITFKNGKYVERFDNSGATGAVTYISVPENGDKVTVFMVYGGDVHRLGTCISKEDAQTLVDGYVSGMKKTYGKDNVTVYNAK